MRPFALRLAAALLTFFVGVTLAALWYSPAVTQREVIEIQVSSPAPPALVAPRMPAGERAPVGSLTQDFVKGGVLNGKAVSKPAPDYPPIAKAARASGTVIVRVVVGESGRVEKAEAISGHPLLQEAAVAAAREARFSPTLLSGQPVKVSGFITYNFVLQ
ncbi:MAG TPA: TonB family protein [Pyrinomonadaceae bacterium]|jgi:protein TonB|nr:TonB family protein [Pyrinomonadaceae bacterium]